MEEIKKLGEEFFFREKLAGEDFFDFELFQLYIFLGGPTPYFVQKKKLLAPFSSIFFQNSLHPNGTEKIADLGTKLARRVFAL